MGDPLMKTQPLTRLLFVLFMVVSNWMILATLTAVVSENMITVSRQQEKEEKTKHELSTKVLAQYRLKMLFEEMDTNHDRTIDELEFKDLMNTPVLRDELVDATGLCPEDLEDLFSFLS